MVMTDLQRHDFPIVLIGIGKVIEGATRLQKYGFLCAMKIKELKKFDFYDDWKASNFGPFSPELASDLKMAEKLGLIKKYQITNPYGYPVERFALAKDEEIVRDFQTLHYSEYKKMADIIKFYQNKTLSELLQDVYFQFPQFAKASTIKPDIGKKIYESDSYLSTKYDNPDSEY